MIKKINHQIFLRTKITNKALESRYHATSVPREQLFSSAEYIVSKNDFFPENVKHASDLSYGICESSN